MLKKEGLSSAATNTLTYDELLVGNVT